MSPRRAPPRDRTAAPVRKLFGTDGIRGKANEPPMTPETALALGRAIALVARHRKTRPARIVIGKDTRLSGYMLETALAAGICAMGGRVMLSGPIPTPAVAHLTTSMRADAGVVISASHNPYEDNGIKLFGPDGFKLPDADEAEIERIMASSDLRDDCPTGAAVGRAERLEDARGRYTVFCKQTFPRTLSLDGVRIVLDAAHGAAYRVAPAVFTELGADVHALGVRPNGRNINDGAGALHPEHLALAVQRHRAHLGVALDGDADRAVFVDERGQVVDGDAVMALLALRKLAQGTLAKRTLVATVMSNLGLERALEGAGGKLVRTAVGDRYVVEAMRKGGYTLGGEQSGHLVFLEHATTGDGIVAGLQVLAAMRAEEKPLSELVSAAMTPVPQLLRSVVLPRRLPLEAMPALTKAEARVGRALGKRGRVLVRWSGTEPKLRVMVEGERLDRVTAMVDELVEAARRDTESVIEPLAMAAAFVTESLSRTFRDGTSERRVLVDLWLTIEEGEMLAIRGASGSGKSTLLSILGGLDRGYTGKVRSFGLDLAAAREAELGRHRNRHHGFVFQAFHLLPHLTVLENVTLPGLFSGDDADRTARAREVLGEVGLADRADEPPTRLSGGQRQRVAIARALLMKPSALLCDEPTGNLDRKTSGEIIELLAELSRLEKTTVVVVTHDAALASRAHRQIEIVDGRIS